MGYTDPLRDRLPLAGGYQGLHRPGTLYAADASSAEGGCAESECHVKVMELPHSIEKIGDLRPEELREAGLLYLPNPYVVPGGRFNEMYGWIATSSCWDLRRTTGRRWPRHRR